MMQQFHVRASWDSEARVWFASSDDVPGLATEADNLDALEAKLQVMVPELLEANGVRTTGKPDKRLQITFLTEKIF